MSLASGSWSSAKLGACVPEYQRHSNGSELKEGLESPNNIFNLPEEKSLPGDDVPVPYYIVGDNAFEINKRLMNPFTIRNMVG
jgi:hypothetical protein